MSYWFNLHYQRKGNGVICCSQQMMAEDYGKAAAEMLSAETRASVEVCAHYADRQTKSGSWGGRVNFVWIRKFPSKICRILGRTAYLMINTLISIFRTNA